MEFLYGVEAFERLPVEAALVTLLALVAITMLVWATEDHVIPKATEMEGEPGAFWRAV